jgi:hypothetical protein
MKMKPTFCVMASMARVWPLGFLLGVHM